jgi:hypothetical protein
MRVFPEILFVLDESIEKAFNMSQILDGLARERGEGGPAPAPAPAPAPEESKGEEE